MPVGESEVLFIEQNKTELEKYCKCQWVTSAANFNIDKLQGDGYKSNILDAKNPLCFFPDRRQYVHKSEIQCQWGGDPAGS